MTYETVIDSDCISSYIQQLLYNYNIQIGRIMQQLIK